MWEGLLPIGSVVLLKGTEQKLMIAGVCAMPGDDPDNLYDYVAFLHPFGYLDRDKVFVFNQEDIETVCAVGYMDDEHFAVYDNVNRVLKGVRSGELTVEELRNARPPMPEILPR